MCTYFQGQALRSNSRSVVTMNYTTPHHFYETIMNKTIKNHISHIENNFSSCRREIGMLPLVKVVRGGDFYNRFVH